jgi:DNA-directed RNA polymerase specialized sigma24 family protein
MAKKKIVRKRRGKSKAKNKGYFRKEHQDAIVQFCSSDCPKEKEQLYTDIIREALEKLSENLIYVYGFHKQHDNVDILKQDCVINLYETLHKFDASKGHRAFSYFNVVAKHWLIIHSRKKNKHKFRHVSIDDPDNEINVDALFHRNGQYVAAPSSMMEKAEKTEEIRQLFNEIRKRVRNEREIKCVDAIIEIFNKVDELDFLNKRAIFVYVREMSGLNSKQLSVCMSSIRSIYRQLNGSGKEFDIL